MSRALKAPPGTQAAGCVRSISVSRLMGPGGTPGSPRPLAPVLRGLRLLQGPQRCRWPGWVGGGGRAAPLAPREEWPQAPATLVASTARVPSQRVGSGPFLAASPHPLQPGPHCPSDPGVQPPRPRSPGIYLCPLSDQPHQPGPAWSWWSGAGSWAPGNPPPVLPTRPTAVLCPAGKGPGAGPWGTHGGASLSPWACGEFPVRLGCGPCRRQPGARGSHPPG